MFASKDELFTRPSGGYTIARSVRFRNSASAYFGRTPASNGNRQIFTWSGWVKRGTLGSRVALFNSGDTGSGALNGLQLLFFGDNTIYASATGGITINLSTNAVYRDPSAWYHIVFAVDTTQATSSNRVKIYVNGSQVTSFSTATYPSQNQNFDINNTLYPMKIGASVDTATTVYYYDGYMTEINYVDGQQLTPSSFGTTNAITGVWQPAKYTGTYGTNGFYLNFSDNSNNTATTIGKDYSGNGNNWTPNNISVTAGTTYDSMVDSPTVGATSSNYAVMNPLYPSSIPVDGNLNVVGDSNSRTVAGTMSSSTGKWYAEGTFTSGYATNGWFFVWDTSTPYVAGNVPATTGQTGAYYRGTNGNISKSVTGTTTSIGTYSTWTNGDIIGMAFDADAGTISFYKNNTLQVTITDSSFIGRPLTFGLYYYAGNASMNFGQRPFSYTPPTGYVALNTYNLPASTITNGASYMYPVLRTGTGSSGGSVTSLLFQPDLIWDKPRSNAGDHVLTDSVRGTASQLHTNTTGSQDTSSQFITAFNSNGYTIGTSDWNAGWTLVDWCWKAGGTSASNTNGSVTTTVSANTTAGFSVVTYTGTGANATFGHGLGVAPSMVITKKRNSTSAWVIGFTYSGFTWSTDYFQFDTSAKRTNGAGTVFTAAPTSTVFSLGTDAGENGNGDTFVAYCFAAVAGYSAFGSYTGNGSTDGTFVYTGFRPRFVLFKNTGTAGSSWGMKDTSRSPTNVANGYLFAESSGAEGTASSLDIDFLSNGFKFRGTSGDGNGSGNNYIYACFAENPFKNALAR